MNRSSKILTVVTLFLGLQLVFLPAAHAYLDPGSGSFIFQALVGTALAVGLGVKLFWRRIVAFVTRRERPTDEP